MPRIPPPPAPRSTLLPLLALLALLSPALRAAELVYTPVNPSFGGSPLNGTWLLNSAQAQNDFKDPSSSALSKKTDLESFNDRLQRSILDRLAGAVTQQVVGPDGQIVPGNIETQDYLINIADNGDGTLTITTTDKASGASTTFEIAQAVPP